MFWPLTPPQGSSVCVRTEYVFPWCSMLHSLLVLYAQFAIPGVEGVFKDIICSCMSLCSRFHINSYATWPCSETVEFWAFDPIPQDRGIFRKYICYHVAAFVIPFNLICIMTMFWKSWALTFWPNPQGRVGSAGKDIYYHVVACVIPLNLICNITMIWKSWILTFRPHPHGRGGGGQGSRRQDTCYHVAAFVISFSLICNMTMFWKVEFWHFDSTPRVGVRGWGLRAKYLLPCYHVAACVIPLIWYVTLSYSKKKALASSPPPKTQGSVPGPRYN